MGTSRLSALSLHLSPWPAATATAPWRGADARRSPRPLGLPALGTGFPVPKMEEEVGLMSPLSLTEQIKYSSVLGVVKRGLGPHSDA